MNPEIERVNDRINSVIHDFADQQGSNTFHMVDLEKFVQNKVQVAPDSPGRILRMMRKKGELEYTLINRSKSLYQFSE
jgi:hypothetical protein